MAGGTGTYKRILQLLEKWPIDQTKAGRDIGEFLVEKINLAYKNDKFVANHKYWDSEYLAIQRLVNNEYRHKYPRLLSGSATGLNAEQCKTVLSNEFLEELQTEDQPFWQKLFSKKQAS